MSDTLPPPIVLNYKNKGSIPAPSYEAFTSRFGDAFPKPEFLSSDLGVTAVYQLPAPSGQTKRRVLMIHGINTPALGLLPLAKQLQARDPDAHVVLFDLWGHGLSSTPLIPHAAHIFEAQIYQVLGFAQWTEAHFLGYSFGGSVLTRFALHNPWAVASATLLAPAGILSKDLFAERLRDLLDNPKGREAEAIEAVLLFLEGGPIVVPADWQERVRRGEIVAEAFREWELLEHRGYRDSVYSMFTGGSVYGCEDYFRKFAQLSLKKVAVLGETDEVCDNGTLASLGFDNIQVVPEHGHGLVRSAPSEVARIVYEMWTQ
ncbi:Alpha/Beta hydrolase protein [Xylaria cf. heliscus]|nr:Alpha/Beta hydrolase protein [Xylaria cf. heliscus]